MLQIYNSFTQAKAPFKPRVPGEVSLYVCGVTVYDYCHLGHARCYVAFDVIHRFLLALGYRVNYVRNITDVDDKIIKRAAENKEEIPALTARFIEAMHQDFKALNILPPTQEPRATQYMDQIITMIQQLVDKGFAYVSSSGDVCFEVASYKDYGALSHKDLEQLQSGARVEVVTDKRNPMDFVLWKMAKPNELHWPSPWGDGRPGWHSECAAMSTDCLGHTFDIHGGGHDLLFPHHENERAQAECVTGETFVNVWVHNGFVQINKEKMSKSLDNFFTIRDIMAEHEPEVVRYFLMASHYRSPVNYSTDLLVQAKQALTRLYTALRGVDIPTVSKSDMEKDPFYQAFFEAMCDDFNTPIAMSVLFDLAHAVNTRREKQDPTYRQAAAILKHCANLMGFLEDEPEKFLQGGQENVGEIEALIKAREDARRDKDWAKADAIRQELTQKGIQLEDTANGTIWREG